MLSNLEIIGWKKIPPRSAIRQAKLDEAVGRLQFGLHVRNFFNPIISKLDKHVVLLPITYYSTQKQMKRANFWWKVSRFFQIDSLNKKYPIYFKFNQKGSVDNIGLTDSYIIKPRKKSIQNCKKKAPSSMQILPIFGISYEITPLGCGS